VDRLRALIPKALDVLAEELDKPDSPNRLKAASEILRLAQLPGGSGGIGPTEPEKIVREIVTQRRKDTPGVFDGMLEDGKGLPPFDRHMEETWQELEAVAAGPETAEAAE
jgi:hypothetical protein